MYLPYLAVASINANDCNDDDDDDDRYVQNESISFLYEYLILGTRHARVPLKAQ